jgi:hypothetical protein
METDITSYVVIKNDRAIIEYERGVVPYLFRDVITMPVERYNSIAPEVIEQIKDQRYNNWIALVKPAPVTE